MYLAVGVAKDLAFDPAKYKYGRIHLYRILEGGRKLEFCNKTKLPIIFFSSTYPMILLLREKMREALEAGLCNLYVGEGYEPVSLDAEPMQRRTSECSMMDRIVKGCLDHCTYGMSKIIPCRIFLAMFEFVANLS